MGLISWVKRGYQEIFKSPSLYHFGSIIYGPYDALFPKRCLKCGTWVRKDVWLIKRWGNWPMPRLHICMECALTKRDARDIFDAWEEHTGL